MKNHMVTKETAHRLKNAGYPQPERTLSNAWQWGLCSNNIVYLPVATEIMEQPEMLMCDLFYAHPGGLKWQCQRQEPADGIWHDNPAEAAAEMYLKIKNR